MTTSITTTTNPLDEWESQQGLAFKKVSSQELVQRIVDYAHEMEKRLAALDSMIFDIFAEHMPTQFEYVDSEQALRIIENVLIRKEEVT